MRARVTALVVSGAGGMVLSWTVAQHSLLGARWDLEWLLAAWVPLWLVAGWAAAGLPRRASLGATILLAVALRLAAASGTTPSISNDLYRYTWDAHVQLSAVDPYRYPPDAPQLVRLRTPPVWPAAGACVRVRLKPGCVLLNRPADRTIYPPVAEAWFDAVQIVTFGSSGSRTWQLAGGSVDMATVGLLIFGLRQRGRDPRQVAWYALSPLPVVEFAGNGHVDGLALLLLVAAALALRRGSAGWAGALVGLATMVKIYPVLAIAAWWRRGRWRLALPAVAVAVVSELPHVMVVGTRVLGYLPGYLKEERYSSGGRFLLLGLLGLHGPAATTVAALILVALTAVIARASWEPATSLAAVLSALFLVTTPVQPWYAATLAGIGLLAGAPWLAVIGIAAEPYYAVVILADRHQVGVGRLAYGGALLTVVAAAALRARNRIRIGSPAGGSTAPGRHRHSGRPWPVGVAPRPLLPAAARRWQRWGAGP